MVDKCQEWWTMVKNDNYHPQYVYMCVSVCQTIVVLNHFYHLQYLSISMSMYLHTCLFVLGECSGQTVNLCHCQSLPQTRGELCTDSLGTSDDQWSLPWKISSWKWERWWLTHGFGVVLFSDKATLYKIGNVLNKSGEVTDKNYIQSLPQQWSTDLPVSVVSVAKGPSPAQSVVVVVVVVVVCGRQPAPHRSEVVKTP